MVSDNWMTSQVQKEASFYNKILFADAQMLPDYQLNGLTSMI